MRVGLPGFQVLFLTCLLVKNSNTMWGWDSLLVGMPDSWLNPGRSSWRIFFSRVNFVCWLLFGVHSTPGSLQWHVKDPSHSAKSTDGRLHLNTHTPLTQQSQRNLSRNELTSNLSGNIRPQSTQLAEPLWTDPGIKSGISMHVLISTLKKRRSAGRE